MSRTVNINDEIIVVSEGKKDIGKLAILGNDGKFDPSVIPVIDELQDQINKEVNERIEGDKALQTNIDSEASTRTTADRDLQDQITKEVMARTEGDKTLQTNIDVEVSARTASDQGLQDQISKEVLARGEGDKQLQENIDSEVSTRTTADQQLRDQIATEIAARTNGDQTESSTRASLVEGLQAQIDALKAECVPTGAVEYFAMTVAPQGWLKADGSVVSRSQYDKLFAAVGTLFGVGDGSTTFNLPDLRGEFIRGFDDARGVDSGRTVGSVQADENKTHSHEIESNYNDYYAGTGNGGPFRLTGNDGTTTTDGHADFFVNTESAGGTETRPRNLALLACIKY